MRYICGICGIRDVISSRTLSTSVLGLKISIAVIQPWCCPLLILMSFQTCMTYFLIIIIMLTLATQKIVGLPTTKVSEKLKQNQTLIFFFSLQQSGVSSI